MTIFEKTIYIIIFFSIMIKTSILNSLNNINNQFLFHLLNSNINSIQLSNDLKTIIYLFLEKNSNFNFYVKELNTCFNNLVNIYDYGIMYLNSGKGNSEPGLEIACEQQNYSYYFITYLYSSLSFKNLDDDSEIYQFINQTSFYTGFCVHKNCTAFVELFLNKKENKQFFDYLEREFSIIKFEYFNKEKKNKYNFEENDKYLIFIIMIILFILFIQIIFYIIYCFTNIEYKKEKNISYLNDYDEELSNNIFTHNTPLINKDKGKDSYFYLMISNFNFFNYFQILIKKENKIYNDTNLEFIAFLRVIVMILLTIIQNFLVLIHIPSKDFFNKEFYEDFLFVIIKFSSFSLDFYISIEGFLMIFKLLSYIKKNVYNKNKNNVSFGIFFSFIFYSFYKIFPFIILSLMLYYYQINFIYYFSSSFLVNHYLTNVFNENFSNKMTELFLPGITLYAPYNNYFQESFYSYYTYIFLYLNEFFVFIFSLFIIFLSLKLKNKKYDIFVFIIIIINIILTILISLNYDDNNELYNFNKIINAIYNIKYPHLMLNNYFIGIFTGVICFSFKDFTSNKSIIQSENQYIPFEFLFNIFRCFGLVSDVIKKIFIFIFIIIIVIISSSFKILIFVKGNFIIEFSSFEKFIYYYEKPLIVIFFNLIIIFVYSIDYDMSKRNNFFNFFIFFSRIDFSFIFTGSQFIYTLYCIYNFQLKLSFQNLISISLGLFMIILFFNILLTISIVLPFKQLFKKII